MNKRKSTNNKKEDLFLLIKSMDPVEKRYFKLDANRATGKKKSNYIKLFDAINSMEEYDENKLKLKLKKEAFVKHLAQEKKYLYEVLLASIRKYKKQHDPLANVEEKILNARYLYERRLYAQSWRMLQKAKRQAYDYEFFEQVLIVIGLEQGRFFFLNESDKEGGKDREAYQLEWKKTIDSIQEIEEYRNLYLKVNKALNKKYSLKENKAFEKFKQNFEKKTLPIHASTLKTTSAKFYLYTSLMVYFQFVKKHEQTSTNLDLLTNLIDLNPFLLEVKRSNYFQALSNYMGSCFRADRYDEMGIILEQMKKLPLNNHHDEIRARYSIYFYGLLYYMNICDFEKAKELEKDIVKVLAFKIQISDVASLGFKCNLAILSFVLNDFEKSLKWLDEIFLLKNNKEHMYITHFATWFQLILYFELGNTDLFESKHRSASRDMIKRKEKYILETIVLSYTKKLMNIAVRDRKDIFNSFYKEVKKLEKNKEEKNSIGLKELTLWLESKVKLKEIVEIFKEEQAKLLKKNNKERKK